MNAERMKTRSPDDDHDLVNVVVVAVNVDGHNAYDEDVENVVD